MSSAPAPATTSAFDLTPLACAPALALACPDEALEWPPGWLLRGLTRLPVQGA